jgi:hypothetical protein
VLQLLEKGADVNAVSDNGFTPLHTAAARATKRRLRNYYGQGPISIHRIIMERQRCTRLQRRDVTSRLTQRTEMNTRLSYCLTAERISTQKIIKEGHHCTWRQIGEMNTRSPKSPFNFLVPCLWNPKIRRPRRQSGEKDRQGP